MPTDGIFFKMRTKTVEKLTRREQLVEDLKRKILTDPPENHIETLSDKQLSAITFLIECPSMQEAAEKSGVSVRTLRRWIAIRNILHAGVDEISPAISLPQKRLKRVFQLEIGDVDTDGPAFRASQQVNGSDVRRLIVPLRHVGEILVVPRSVENAQRSPQRAHPAFKNSVPGIVQQEKTNQYAGDWPGNKACQRCG